MSTEENLSGELFTLPWCEWCREFDGPVIQLEVGDVLHRWSFVNKRQPTERAWTKCGFEVRMVTVEEILAGAKP